MLRRLTFVDCQWHAMGVGFFSIKFHLTYQSRFLYGTNRLRYLMISGCGAGLRRALTGGAHHHCGELPRVAVRGEQARSARHQRHHLERAPGSHGCGGRRHCTGGEPRQHCRLSRCFGARGFARGHRLSLTQQGGLSALHRITRSPDRNRPTGLQAMSRISCL